MADGRMGASTADGVIAAALAEDRYVVDTVAGLVLKKLACGPDRRGYPTISLTTAQAGHASVRVHRVVAAAAWGIDAIRGRWVGHRNGIRTDNRLANLWLPASIAEHNEHDGLAANLLPGGKVTTQWDPCTRCGDPGGYVPQGKRTPVRIAGTRFGITGALCYRCYGTLDMRQRRRARRKAAEV